MAEKSLGFNGKVLSPLEVELYIWAPTITGNFGGPPAPIDPYIFEPGWLVMALFHPALHQPDRT